MQHDLVCTLSYTPGTPLKLRLVRWHHEASPYPEVVFTGTVPEDLEVPAGGACEVMLAALTAALTRPT